MKYIAEMPEFQEVSCVTGLFRRYSLSTECYRVSKCC